MRAFYVFFFAFGTTAVKIYVSISNWRHSSSVYKTFCMENGCFVFNAFILDERQPCIKPFGMRNDCRLNSAFILYARQPCI